MISSAEMKADCIFLFLTGFTAGFILTVLLGKTPVKIRHSETVANVTNPTVIIESVRKIRILCFLNTSPRNHKKRAVHIRNTWAKHCDKLVDSSINFELILGLIFCKFLD